MNRFKLSSILFLSAVLLTLSALPASARDICVGDGSQTFVFRKVKSLKPGGAIVLNGLYVDTANGFIHPLGGMRRCTPTEGSKWVFSSILAAPLAAISRPSG
jgi:hypothetical protein